MNRRRAFIILFLLSLVPLSASAEDTVGGYPPEKALQLGEKMYREGVLSSGEPMEAMVMGDIPMDGRMFTCDDCHQRSGLGSEEGTIITWPTNGKEIYQPRKITGAYKEPQEKSPAVSTRGQLPKYYQVDDARPAYTDQTLAKVLRTGVDPSGRKLDPIMPKFHLDKENMDIMVHYLKNLSVEISPGVDDQSIEFATIISDKVPESKKTAMLSVLQAHIDAHNAQTRHEGKRAKSGPFYKSEKHQAYRSINLHIWTVTGPESTWNEQLESYYNKQPVFGFLGGITAGAWAPIHRFSEQHKIPTIFPITNQPTISKSDWYTLYFSKGLYQEGESAAKYVRQHFKGKDTLQIAHIYNPDNARQVALAKGFEQTWQNFADHPLSNLDYNQFLNNPEKILTSQSDNSQPVVLITWLDPDEIHNLDKISDLSSKISLIIASATLLNNDFSSLSDEIRGALLLTYPVSLPGTSKESQFAVRRWLKARKIEENHFDIQAKMYFLGWMLPGALKSMRSEFFREYFMEGFDMMTDQDYAIAVYPRLTFGPGQRYASKGCYLVKLAEAPGIDVVPVTDWVVY